VSSSGVTADAGVLRLPGRSRRKLDEKTEMVTTNGDARAVCFR
jgi:hypothetical protein